ncbi:hypothetical protein AB6C95_006860 [Vibrio cyclitrophicus]
MLHRYDGELSKATLANLRHEVGKDVLATAESATRAPKQWRHRSDG